MVIILFNTFLLPSSSGTKTLGLECSQEKHVLFIYCRSLLRQHTELDKFSLTKIVYNIIWSTFHACSNSYLFSLNKSHCESLLARSLEQSAAIYKMPVVWVAIVWFFFFALCTYVCFDCYFMYFAVFNPHLLFLFSNLLVFYYIYLQIGEFNRCQT